MKYCNQCIMPTTRPGLTLDDKGVCGACRWHKQKKSIDWISRLQDLQRTIDWAKEESKSPWSCVLGVSGGKDSTWQAMMIREKLGVDPLLVQFVSSDGTEVGRQNIENLHSLGFTLISMQPNPQVAQILSRKSYRQYGNLHKYAEMALFSIPYRVAMAYGIPLVLFGENPALEAGDKNEGEGWDATTIRNNNTLGGDTSAIWLGEGVTPKDLIQYDFPSEEDFKNWKGKGVFMGYYMDWSGWDNAVYAISHGMHCIDAPYDDIGIHYKHNSLDSEFGGIINSMLKHTKFGFGNTTEFVCYDIRDGRLTREEGALLVKSLDGKCHPKYIESYCEWIGIQVDEFEAIKENYRTDIWKKRSNQWVLDNPIWEQLNIRDCDSIESILARIDTRPYAKGVQHDIA